jgi:prepilin-type N-terminal cleavage/methylation domain-containing protein
MKKLLKSQKGMTLVELVVGMVMFAIAVGAIGAIMVPTLRVYAEANEYAESNNLLDTLANQILDDLSEATSDDTTPAPSVAVDPDTNVETLTFHIDTRSVAYTIGADPALPPGPERLTILLRNGTPVYTEEFYKGKNLAFTADTSKAPVYTLTLSITGGISISRPYSIRPVAVTIS